jgi:hypothetical protein
MMEIIKLKFNRGYGRGAKTGQIDIAKPSGIIHFTKEQISANNVLTQSLQGGWNFPSGLIGKMQAVVKTGSDYKGNWGREIPINGNPKGKFSDLMSIYPADKPNITTVRFDIYDMKDQLKWRSPSFILQTQMVEGDALLAKISRIIKGIDAGTGGQRVCVDYDIQFAPQNTSRLTLTLASKKGFVFLWPTGINHWKGPGRYSFVADRAIVLGEQEGFRAILCAMNNECKEIAKYEEEFTLDKVGSAQA